MRTSVIRPVGGSRIKSASNPQCSLPKPALCGKASRFNAGANPKPGSGRAARPSVQASPYVTWSSSRTATIASSSGIARSPCTARLRSVLMAPALPNTARPAASLKPGHALALTDCPGTATSARHRACTLSPLQVRAHAERVSRCSAVPARAADSQAAANSRCRKANWLTRALRQPRRQALHR